MIPSSALFELSKAFWRCGNEAAATQYHGEAQIAEIREADPSLDLPPSFYLPANGRFNPEPMEKTTL